MTPIPVVRLVFELADKELAPERVAPALEMALGPPCCALAINPLHIRPSALKTSIDGMSLLLKPIKLHIYGVAGSQLMAKCRHRQQFGELL